MQKNSTQRSLKINQTGSVADCSKKDQSTENKESGKDPEIGTSDISIATVETPD
jgi:hypothetical protein